MYFAYVQQVLSSYSEKKRKWEPYSEKVLPLYHSEYAMQKNCVHSSSKLYGMYKYTKFDRNRAKSNNRISKLNSESAFSVFWRIYVKLSMISIKFGVVELFITLQPIVYTTLAYIFSKPRRGSTFQRMAHIDSFPGYIDCTCCIYPDYITRIHGIMTILHFDSNWNTDLIFYKVCTIII